MFPSAPKIFRHGIEYAYKDQSQAIKDIMKGIDKTKKEHLQF